jgi:hypothetical protein
METNERSRQIQRQDADSAGTQKTGDLGNLRQAGEDLLNAADDAINRALSGDSEAFLAANRQMGGQ